jgi:hypothetical protein
MKASLLILVASLLTSSYQAAPIPSTEEDDGLSYGTETTKSDTEKTDLKAALLYREEHYKTLGIGSKSALEDKSNVAASESDTVSKEIESAGDKAGEDEITAEEEDISAKKFDEGEFDDAFGSKVSDEDITDKQTDPAPLEDLASTSTSARPAVVASAPIASSQLPASTGTSLQGAVAAPIVTDVNVESLPVDPQQPSEQNQSFVPLKHM